MKLFRQHIHHSINQYNMLISKWINPLKPTPVDFSNVFYAVLFVCFYLQRQPAFFAHSFEDLGCLVVMNYDASCIDKMTYVCWWYLQRCQLPYCAPNKEFQFKHCLMFFKLCNVFVPSCDTWNFGFPILRSCRHIFICYLMINMVDMFLASCSFLYSIASVLCCTFAA